MNDVPPPKPPAKEPPDYRVWVAGLLPALVGLVLFWVLFAKMSGSITLDGKDDWNELGKVGAIALIAFGSAILLRLVLSPLVREGVPTPQVVNDPYSPIRNRIAHAVLIVGGASIAILTVSLIIALAVLATKAGTVGATVGGKIDTLLMGVFGAVLPIVATWVGTVIAFYFTNESYRQAAEATREASAGLRPAGPKVTAVMLPYEKIIKEVVDTRTAADTMKIAKLLPKFDALVTRVIIFEKAKRNPIYIIRRKYLADAFLAGDPDVTAYRNQSAEIAADSKWYGFVAESATVAEAKQAMVTHRYEDLFVTGTGQPTEEVLGWVSDDMVKGI